MKSNIKKLIIPKNLVKKYNLLEGTKITFEGGIDKIFLNVNHI